METDAEYRSGGKTPDRIYPGSMWTSGTKGSRLATYARDHKEQWRRNSQAGPERGRGRDHQQPDNHHDQ